MADESTDEARIDSGTPQQNFRSTIRRSRVTTSPDGVEADDFSEGQPMFDVLSRPLGTNDFPSSDIEGDPGQAIPWHTHTPITQQASIPTNGRVRVGYTDTDEETHSTEAGPGEMASLPAGAHTKIEAIGEDRLEMLVVERETLIGRVEQLLEDSEGGYDPKDDPASSPGIDSLRGEVIRRDADAVGPD